MQRNVCSMCQRESKMLNLVIGFLNVQKLTSVVKSRFVFGLHCCNITRMTEKLHMNNTTMPRLHMKSISFPNRIEDTFKQSNKIIINAHYDQQCTLGKVVSNKNAWKHLHTTNPRQRFFKTKTKHNNH